MRAGFEHLDAGEIDEFEIDDQWLQAAAALEYMRDLGEEHDWWAKSASGRDHS